jgi:hypothetical protein
MIQLRGGQVTHDPRLDRIREVDLRSLAYPVATVLPREAYAKPRSYSWSIPDPAPLDQGSEGACVGFGFTHDALARPVIVENATNATARSWYHEAQDNDEWAGTGYEGTSVLAGAKVGVKRGFFSEYRWCLDIYDMAATVGYKGPVVIGVDWYSGMDSWDSDGFLKATGTIRGGHCVCVNKVRIVKADDTIDFLRSYFTLTNSWSKSWGIDGRARLSFADMAKLFPGADVCVPLYRKDPLD